MAPLESKIHNLTKAKTVLTSAKHPLSNPSSWSRPFQRGRPDQYIVLHSGVKVHEQVGKRVGGAVAIGNGVPHVSDVFAMATRVAIVLVIEFDLETRYGARGRSFAVVPVETKAVCVYV